MYSKIINPKTGRKVNVNGRLGKSIIRNYIVFVNGGELGGKTKEALRKAGNRQQYERRVKKLNKIRNMGKSKPVEQTLSEQIKSKITDRQLERRLKTLKL
tara:strand:- start:835 stop:1134 length:300 start_codon:yes stop_codon:yes gene_type:complete